MYSLLAQVAIQGFLDVVFAAIAYELFHDLAVFENEQSRNAGDFVSHGGSAVAVNIHLTDGYFALILTREFFDDWSDRAAGATPRSPEIDQHGLIGLQYICIKIGVCDLDDAVACHSSSRILSSRSVDRLVL